MMYHIRSTFILLFLTMLLFSACRTAHSAAKEESATQTTESSQSSVASDTSFASLFRALSLRADSIVLWLQDGETVPTITSSEESGQSMSDNQSFCLCDSGSTAQSTNSTLPSARPSSKGHTLSKVLIGGLHLESQAAEKKVTSTHARDSLSAKESRDSSLSEAVEEEPPNSFARVYIIIGMLISVVLLLVAILIKKRLSLFKTFLKRMT